MYHVHTKYYTSYVGDYQVLYQVLITDYLRYVTGI